MQKSKKETLKDNKAENQQCKEAEKKNVGGEDKDKEKDGQRKNKRNVEGNLSQNS